ncbi:hypothetical protein [Alkalicoccus urumqiensis]|uniref:Uncharacterized protein n=1 Tax=Alkalicoccus urumqiensis TaxID=1548213 RepID=A0A2P6MKJ7_ALKUR|nr:hypothetical protein [Alkalicoccus urumqiensis]PRO66785.1 hypothetical protein C6I21_02360 [Alkalicoccus urumqiensis]
MDEQEEEKLPSRMERSRKSKKKKKHKAKPEFPLVRIWLILFFVLIFGILLYPFWFPAIY